MRVEPTSTESSTPTSTDPTDLAEPAGIVPADAVQPDAMPAKAAMPADATMPANAAIPIEPPTSADASVDKGARTAAEPTKLAELADSPAHPAAEPADAEPAEPGGIWGRGRRRLTVGLVLMVTLVALETLAVITILPVVSADLDGIGLYGWVTSALFLGTIVGLVMAGAATDRTGPARPFTMGLALFAGGLTVSACAPTMAAIVGGRALQGLGGGAIAAIAYAVVGRAYPEQLHPRMFAVLSTAWVVPGLVGPAAAAVVADGLGWRWVFAGIVPLLLIIGIPTISALRPTGRPPATARAAAGMAGTTQTGNPAPPPAAGNPAGERSPVSTVGPTAEKKRAVLADALRVSTGAGLVLAGITSRSPWGIIMVAAGVLVGFGPLRRLLPAGALRARPGTPAAVAARGLLTFTFFGADIFVPLTITSVRAAPTALAGVAVTTATVCWTAGSWTQARLASRVTRRDLVTAGFAALVAGIAVTGTLLAPVVPLPIGIAGWGLAGFGIGLAFSPIASVVLVASPPERQGAASTAVQLADNLGVAFGAGISGVAVAASDSATGSVTAGVGAAFAITAAVGVLGAAVARRLPARTVPGTPPT